MNPGTPMSHLQKSHRRTGLRPIIGLSLLAMFGLLPASALAQTDTLHPTSGNPVRGTILSAGREGVVMRVGQAEQTFAPARIEKIAFQGDPTGLTRGREAALDGQYGQAIEELRTVDLGRLGRDIVRQDVLFYQVYSQARLALAGQGDKNKAIAAVFDFARQNPTSWHFFAAARLSGDLALAIDDYDRAIRFYGSLQGAPSEEAKVEMRYLIGMAELRRGDLAKARGGFDDVIGVRLESPEVARMQTLARAGKAIALARGGEAEQGVELAKGLIADLNPADSALAAQIYNALGASYAAAGDAEGAVLAYLHTHLMFSGQGASHAEALAELVQLWETIGHPDRAAEARQELRQRYPGFQS